MIEKTLETFHPTNMVPHQHGTLEMIEARILSFLHSPFSFSSSYISTKFRENFKEASKTI